jgi:putative addiction module killer protein
MVRQVECRSRAEGDDGSIQRRNFSNAKSVGAGVYQCKINFGPGYRVYFGKEGEQIVILLGGGTKQRQQNDIKLALERWEDYKLRKKQHKEKKEEE